MSSRSMNLDAGTYFKGGVLHVIITDPRIMNKAGSSVHVFDI